MEEFHRSVIDRFDQKIHTDTANHVSMERSLARALTSIETIAAAIPKIGETAEQAHDMVEKHHIIALTIIKIGSGIFAVMGISWAIFEFMATR